MNVDKIRTVNSDLEGQNLVCVDLSVQTMDRFLMQYYSFITSQVSENGIILLPFITDFHWIVKKSEFCL